MGWTDGKIEPYQRSDTHSLLALQPALLFPSPISNNDGAKNYPQNFALFHCLTPSLQTALFNGPLVVLVSWALGKDMDLNFEIFMIVLLVLSIVVVGNFLRDGESNYLEGALLMVSYLMPVSVCVGEGCVSFDVDVKKG
jgi:hypothetical protein